MLGVKVECASTFDLCTGPAFGLYSWARAMESFDRVAEVVTPKKAFIPGAFVRLVDPPHPHHF